MIHRFRVSNFKSLLDVSVDLEPVTVLVGKSGTGKSNFLEAIRLLGQLLRSRPGGLFQNGQGSWEECRPAVDPNAQAHFELEFSIKGIEDRYVYSLTLPPWEVHEHPDEERLDLGDKTLFHQRSGRGKLHSNTTSGWLVEPAVVPVPQHGAPALGRIRSLFEVRNAFTALTTSLGWYSFSDRVLTADNRTSQGQTEDDGLLDYLIRYRDIETNLDKLNIQKSLVTTLQRVNESVSSVALDDILYPNHILVGHKFNGKTLALRLSQESDGFRRFFAHLLALYQQPPKQTLLFEHPEDGIHPGALSLLAEEFKAAPADGRGQVILTTHSPKFLDEFEAEQIRVVELDGLQTRIGKLSPEQEEALHEDLLDPGELLTTDPARLAEQTWESTDV